MKKTIIIFILILSITTCLLFSCGEQAGAVAFESSDMVVSSFDGLGVEWGTYEDTNKIVKGSWDRILTAVTRLNPSLVRCMTNLDWFVTDFDDKDNDDLSDDTWNYNFNNKQMVNASNVLDYCQMHGIKVAFGVWNVIGKVDPNEDEIGMIPNATADPRWAKMCADLMEYLIKVKGYTCIQWFVNTNEPNVIGKKGVSKNAYSSYEIWETGMKNVRKAFDNIGLNDLSLIGGDTTTFLASKAYLTKAAKNIPDILDNYGVHLYADKDDLATGKYQRFTEELYEAVQKEDGELGKSKNMYIWEAGLLSGKDPVTDCNGTIMNFSYGLRMADYTIQSLSAGINGIVYWDLDDAMHFMYSDENGATVKEWGMFSTLATADSAKQEYRPWYHSSVLLTNLFRPGYALYSKDTGFDGVRAMAALSPDCTKGGYVVVNNSKNKVKESMRISETVNGGEKLYVYYYNEKLLKIGQDGFVVPNYEIEGTLNREITLEIPANTMVVVSNEKL